MHSTGTQIIAAPVILGLRPTGVENLAATLLGYRLAARIGADDPVVFVPAYNELYNDTRDPDNGCLNGTALMNFSEGLAAEVVKARAPGKFTLVLGGDCSVLVGVMSSLKTIADPGLVFMDAHADFYSPQTSVTGEVADMDLAIVSGRGPDILTNINGQRPYVTDNHIIHIGQRDEDETSKYGSMNICETKISCVNAKELQARGADDVAHQVKEQLLSMSCDQCWIHFDTDVLSDELNPAVDYRLPGGLHYNEVETIVKSVLQSSKCAGMSVTIFNPSLDPDGSIGKEIVASLVRMLVS